MEEQKYSLIVRKNIKKAAMQIFLVNTIPFSKLLPLSSGNRGSK